MPRKKKNNGSVIGYIAVVIIIAVLAMSGAYLFNEGWNDDKWQHGIAFMFAAYTLWFLAIIMTYAVIKMATKKSKK